ncbi:MAG: phenylalanine--tRNA ligase subunit beta [Saprospiraceae bacterium]|nr:phenylalanine--tRNA ligase subunit beta [Saprospiraceae bacterium]
MEISLNWLKNYVDLGDLDPVKIGEILTDIGLEVEGMETVESIPGGLQGLVIGQVTHCERHPNADRLSLTRVDVGQGPELQIVCGAPNVAKGQKVVVATEGTLLHPTAGEPFQIKKGKIRGEVSEGMICAEDEIGLGESHDGIIVLPADAPIGQTAAAYYQVEQDVVYEIGLTPNRSDATSHIGVARDLAAALQIHFDRKEGIRWPDLSAFRPDRTDLPVKVVVENEEACPRYLGVTLANVQVAESPDWLKNRLRTIGLRPINNIVDITNFVLHEYGQPLHAFDLAAIKERTVRVKTLSEGTVFHSLDEQDRKLSAEDLMICNGVSEGMCIAGVFGGLHSGVTESTQNVFLESAHFSPQWIRRTSMRHQLRTDAARIFEKGSDPNIALAALQRAALLMKELAGAEIASEVVDLYPKPIRPLEVEVTFEYVNRLIGVELSKETVLRILQALEMEVLSQNERSFTVAVPTNKSDVTRPADVVEEILRIYGLNSVPIPEHLNSSVSHGVFPDPRAVANRIGDLLAANGLSEIMAVSLSESRYYRDILPREESELVFVNNTSNVQLDVMRPDMLFSGLEALRHNQNRQQPDLKLFEFGKTYVRTEKGIVEPSHLSLFVTGARRPESWLQSGDAKADYYTLRALVQLVLDRMGIGGYQESVLDEDPVFAYGVRYHRGPKALVEFGQVHRPVLQKMDLRSAVYYADLHWDELLAAMPRQRAEFVELNKYPTVRRDLALVVENSVKFSDIVAIARKTGKQLLKEINLFDVYSNEEQLGKGKRSYAVSFSFEDPTKTLKDKEVDKVMNQLIEAYEQKIGAHIRR